MRLVRAADVTTSRWVNNMLQPNYVGHADIPSRSTCQIHPKIIQQRGANELFAPNRREFSHHILIAADHLSV